jgi:hypothetical protein
MICLSMAFFNIRIDANTDDFQDVFEDTDGTTPRPRVSSPESGRSLTDRRPSGTSVDSRDKFDPTLAPPLPSRDAVAQSEEAGATLKKPTSTNSNRISVTDMDEVNLENGLYSIKYYFWNRCLTKPSEFNRAASHSRAPTQTSIKTLSSRIDVDPKGVVPGLSGPVSMNEYPPPPSAPEHKSTTAEHPPSRSKFASPFSWLSRATSGGDKKTLPPLPSPNANNERRGTMSSVNSSMGNAEMMLSKIGEEQESENVRNSRSSLKDRFKMLRMQEEAGINMSGEITVNGIKAGVIGRTLSAGPEVRSPMVATNEKDGSHEPPPMQRGISNPGPQTHQRAPNINTNLAPGTASGMTAGPSATPVDWDLWQSVVYEGPSAVARTSPEELNQAIVSGIPQAIRGVVWQVLAKSKDEKLESTYHDLVAKGTDKEKPAVLTNGHTSHTVGDSGKERESIASAASSIHSNHSTPVSTSLPSVNGDSNDIKFDPMKIQKLEKTIKRDLGARTSYSKYVMAAGLQDGLFGVCKAYALYDDAVGYAQGMNFIAMPILFNVSPAIFSHVFQRRVLIYYRCLKKRLFAYS